MKRVKDERGAISLFVLITMLFFVAILITTYVVITNSELAQAESLSRIKEIYSQNPNSIYEDLTLEADFVIRYAEDFMTFAEMVDSGNSFQGQTVLLARDINFLSDSSYQDSSKKGEVLYYFLQNSIGRGINSDNNYDTNTINNFIGSFNQIDISLLDPSTFFNESNRMFQGSFNGRGKQISDITLSEYGLFSFLGSNGKIENLKMKDMNQLVYINVGGTITNCGIEENEKNVNKISGMVVYNLGGTLYGCYNKASYYNNGTTNIEGIGGIVGINIYGTIAYSYNTGTINLVSQDMYVGGITGFDLRGVYIGCYNTAVIQSQNNVGGIIGTNQYGVNMNSCYNLGRITCADGSTGHAGGVVGGSYTTLGKGNSDATPEIYENYALPQMVNCYNKARVVTSRRNSYAGGIIGENLSYIELKNCYNEGWVYSQNSYSGGLIAVNQHGIIKAGHNLGTIEGVNAGGIIGVNLESNMTEQIGYDSNNQEYTYYTGVTIQDCYNGGLIIASENCSGIVVTDENAMISGCYNKEILTGSMMVGGIVAESGQNTKITNCHNQGEIKTAYITGGIVANSYGEILNSSNQATINGLVYSGGITAANNSALIQNCYNSGTILLKIEQSMVEELEGDSQEEIEAIPIIMGGIVGYNDRGIIQNCYNEADVIADFISKHINTCLGGVVGVNMGAISDCYNLGLIQSVHVAGGITGINTGLIESLFNNMIIQNCYNEGNIIADSSGGIAGNNYGVIVDSYNIGNITGRIHGGGIAGRVSFSFIINCYNKGNIQAKYTGGIVGSSGYFYQEEYDREYLLGIIPTAEETVCYIIASYNLGTLETISAQEPQGSTSQSSEEWPFEVYDPSIGGMIGVAVLEGSKFTIGSYYADTIANSTIGTDPANIFGKIQESQMTTQEFVNILNSIDALINSVIEQTGEEDIEGAYELFGEFVTGDKWKRDTNLTNGGYPILEWQS